MRSTHQQGPRRCPWEERHWGERHTDQLWPEAPEGGMGGAPGVGNTLWTPESESAGTSECSQDSEAHWLPFPHQSTPVLLGQSRGSQSVVSEPTASLGAMLECKFPGSSGGALPLVFMAG